MFKVLINPEHGGSDPGAVFEYWNESILVDILTDFIEGYLKLKSKTIESIRREESWGLLMPIERAKRANMQKVDLMVTICVNAGGGSGLEIYVSPQAYTKTLQYAKIMVDEVKRWYTNKNLPIRGIKEARFTVLQYTDMSSLLIETGFIDNSIDRHFLTNYDSLTRLAKKIGDGIIHAEEYSSMGNKKV